jgi:hypothetical protein
MLLMSYRHLHPLFYVDSSFVDNIDQDSCLNIFEMVANTNEHFK